MLPNICSDSFDNGLYINLPFVLFESGRGLLNHHVFDSLIWFNRTITDVFVTVCYSFFSSHFYSSLVFVFYNNKNHSNTKNGEIPPHRFNKLYWVFRFHDYCALKIKRYPDIILLIFVYTKKTTFRSFPTNPKFNL